MYKLDIKEGDSLLEIYSPPSLTESGMFFTIVFVIIFVILFFVGGVFLFFIIFLRLLFSPHFIFGLLGLLFTSVFIYFFIYIPIRDIFNNRESWLSLNRRTGVINHKLGGLLYSSFLSKTNTYNFDDIVSLDILKSWKDSRQMYVGKDIDRIINLSYFQIVLMLRNNQKINISASKSTFEDCQKYINLIHKFIGEEVSLNTPIDGIDFKTYQINHV